MWPFAHLARLMTDTIFTVKSLSTDVERDLINKEVGDPKHSTYHVEHGPMTVDNTADLGSNQVSLIRCILVP